MRQGLWVHVRVLQTRPVILFIYLPYNLLSQKGCSYMDSSESHFGIHNLTVIPVVELKRDDIILFHLLE